jgi:hypothetical protein
MNLRPKSVQAAYHAAVHHAARNDVGEGTLHRGFPVTEVVRLISWVFGVNSDQVRKDIGAYYDGLMLEMPLNRIEELNRPFAQPPRLVERRKVRP